MPYWEAEAAAHFGVALGEFRERSVRERGEMVAHLWIKAARERYAEHRAEQKAKNKPASGGINPIEAQRREWRLS